MKTVEEVAIPSPEILLWNVWGLNWLSVIPIRTLGIGKRFPRVLLHRELRTIGMYYRLVVGLSFIAFPKRCRATPTTILLETYLKLSKQQLVFVVYRYECTHNTCCNAIILIMLTNISELEVGISPPSGKNDSSRLYHTTEVCILPIYWCPLVE